MRAIFLLLSLSAALTPALYADDGASSIAAGGIIVMKREPRIVMAKEVLNISPSRVLVDYDFRNDSDEDITTEVAFPVPAYTLAWDERNPKEESFDDFKLWIDEEPARFTTEIRAFAGKHDITELLSKLHVDASSFGHFDSGFNPKNPQQDPHSPDIDRLSKEQRTQLISAKAFPSEADREPRWSVQKKYHWTQTFPAHSVVHIRHQYTPVLGNSNTIGDPAVYQGKDAVPEYAQSCPAATLRDTLTKVWQSDKDHESSPLSISYVSFILTTANTWKTPIEDFTLIVERPRIPKYKTYVSFCWDGPVTQLDADHFSAHITGLVPKKELMIGYIWDDRR